MTKGTALRPFTPMQLALSLLVVMMLCYWRTPDLFAEPRLWAEEGDLFLPQSLMTGFFEGFWASPVARASALGLLGIVPFAVGVRMLPLEQLPVLTTLFGALLFLLPVLHVLLAPSDLFRSRAVRLLGVAVLLFAPYGAASGETWMNTINSGVHLGVLGLLLCTERFDDAGRARVWYARAILFLGGLSGVYIAVLAPLFALRARWASGREPLVQFGIVAAALAIQVSVAAYLKLSGQILDQRLVSFAWAKAAAGVFQYEVLLPIVGVDFGAALLEAGRIPPASSTAFDWGGADATLFGLASILLIGALLWVLARPVRRGVAFLLVGGFVTWAVLTAFFSVNALPWGRYAVAPAIALGLLLLHAACDGPIRSQRLVAGLLLVPMLVIGLHEFRFRTPDPMTGRNGHAVSWRSEMGQWRSDPDRRVAVWPAGGWYAYVPDPTLLEGLRQRLAALDDAAAGAGAVIEVDGLPAVFGIELAIESGAPVDLTVALVGDAGEILHRFDVAKAAGSVVRLDSNELRTKGFARFSRVRSIEVAGVAAPPMMPRIRIARARFFSPLLTWNHPRSGR